MKRSLWVIKAGSKMVCDGGPILLRSWMQQVHRLREQFGVEVIWVTSGAIAWAAQRTQFKGRKKTLPEKQALSAIGQPLVMDQYSLALHTAGAMGSQILLTAEDIKRKQNRRNLKNAIETLLSWKVLPILNENDAVATREIQFGDNDSLAAEVAILFRAQRLVLMTDVDGLFDFDPRRNKKAQLIGYKEKVLPADLKRVKTALRSEVGTGGMYSKLLAARRASQERVITHLIRGDMANNIIDLALGRKIGTQIGGLI